MEKSAWIIIFSCFLFLVVSETYNGDIDQDDIGNDCELSPYYISTQPGDTYFCYDGGFMDKGIVKCEETEPSNWEIVKYDICGLDSVCTLNDPIKCGADIPSCCYSASNYTVIDYWAILGDEIIIFTSVAFGIVVAVCFCPCLCFCIIMISIVCFTCCAGICGFQITKKARQKRQKEYNEAKRAEENKLVIETTETQMVVQETPMIVTDTPLQNLTQMVPQQQVVTQYVEQPQVQYVEQVQYVNQPIQVVQPQVQYVEQVQYANQPVQVVQTVLSSSNPQNKV